MNRRSLALAAASGLLLAAAFPSFNLSYLAWIALVPLFLALAGQTVKNGFLLGGLAGLVFFAGTVHWVTNSVHFYGGIPVIPASLITLLLCLYLALYPALFGAALARQGTERFPWFFVSAPALWTALELTRTYIFSGFPWSLLGYSQYRVLPVIQMADLTGVYGVSFLIVMVNAALAGFIIDRKKFYGLIVAVLTMVVVVTYGYLRLDARDDTTGKITVTVVQGNIDQDKKWDPAFQSEVISIYKRLTREALKQHTELVIWPETTTPFYFTGSGAADRALTADLIAFAGSSNVPLLFGSPTYERGPDRTIRLSNSAFLLTPRGKIDAVYHKLHLVPFGEYVPLKSVLFFVDKMVQAIGDFQAGNEYTVMTVPARGANVTLSTVICYEIIFPDLVRRFVDNGASVITTITNDAWFGRTAAPYQHFSMAVFRAVENRVPVARAANTGISGFIDSKGNILETSAIFTEACLTRAIAPGGKKTFYTAHGDLFAYACLAISLLLLAMRQGKNLPGNKR